MCQKPAAGLHVLLGNRHVVSVLRMSFGSVLSARADYWTKTACSFLPAPLNVYLRCIFMYRGHLSWQWCKRGCVYCCEKDRCSRWTPAATCIREGSLQTLLQVTDISRGLGERMLDALYCTSAVILLCHFDWNASESNDPQAKYSPHGRLLLFHRKNPLMFTPVLRNLHVKLYFDAVPFSIHFWVIFLFCFGKHT